MKSLRVSPKFDQIIPIVWGSIRTTQLFVQNFSSDSFQIAILS